MRTEYVFDVDTGELVYSRRCEGNHVYAVNYRDEMGTQQLCETHVCEGVTAERAFFNHFGDDSSWPPGWWPRMTEGMFTKKSWTKENYPPSKVSWQEYFGVHDYSRHSR